MNPTMLEHIYTYIRVNEGLSPSIREIAKHCHTNVSKASGYLSVLETGKAVSFTARLKPAIGTAPAWSVV